MLRISYSNLDTIQPNFWFWGPEVLDQFYNDIKMKLLGIKYFRWQEWTDVTGQSLRVEASRTLTEFNST